MFSIEPLSEASVPKPSAAVLIPQISLKSTFIYESPSPIFEMQDLKKLETDQPGELLFISLIEFF